MKPEARAGSKQYEKWTEPADETNPWIKVPNSWMEPDYQTMDRKPVASCPMSPPKKPSSHHPSPPKKPSSHPMNKDTASHLLATMKDPPPAHHPPAMMKDPPPPHPTPPKKKPAAEAHSLAQQVEASEELGERVAAQPEEEFGAVMVPVEEQEEFGALVSVAPVPETVPQEEFGALVLLGAAGQGAPAVQQGAPAVQQHNHSLVAAASHQQDTVHQEAGTSQQLVPYVNQKPADWVTAQLQSLTLYMAEYDVENPCAVLKKHFDKKIDELMAVKPENDEDEEFIKKYILEMDHFMVQAMNGLANAGGTPHEEQPKTSPVKTRASKRAETTVQESRLATIQQKRNPSAKSSLQNAIETRQRTKRNTTANKRRGIGK